MAVKQMSDGDMDKVTKSTAQLLSEQPKRKIKLHLPQEEKAKLTSAVESGKKVEWPFEVVSVNGHMFQIQKGVEVEVPQTVAEILEQAGLI